MPRRQHGVPGWWRLALLTTAVMGSVLATSRSTATAQSPNVRGRVLDSGGGQLPGVTVTAVLEGGGVTWHATSASDGVYTFTDLPEGIYRLDFELRGFDLMRRNDVRVRRETLSTADVTLPVSRLCECIGLSTLPPLEERTGQVVDQEGRPRPHARVEVVAPTRREVSYTDDDGRFIVRLPLDSEWSLSASDAGFRAVTRQVSARNAEAIVFRLAYAGSASLPEQERLDRGCGCNQLLNR